jgi:hypothetical protein
VSGGKFTIADNLTSKWKSISSGAGWNLWEVAMSPLHPDSGYANSPTLSQGFGIVNREVNPQNRHGDTDGWLPEQNRSGKPWVVGEQMVPETQDFPGELGANVRIGYDIFAGFTVGNSPYTASFNKRRVTFSSSSGLLGTYVGDIPNLTPVRFEAVSAGVLPTGLSANTTYWTIRVSRTTSRFATSLANAQANTAIAHTNNGTAPVNLIWYEWHHAKSYAGYQVNPNAIARGGYSFATSGFRPHMVAVSIHNAGSGYTAGDIVTLNANIGNQNRERNATALVTSVNGSGAIQAAELYDGGQFDAAPTGPLSVFGGTGTGAQFNFTMATEASVRPRGAMAISGNYDYGLDFVPQSVQLGEAYASSFSSHAIRLPNGTTSGIAARNAAGSADVPIAALNSSNLIQIGNSTTAIVDPTNNRLGIGRADPQHALDILDSSTTTARVRSTSGGAKLWTQTSAASGYAPSTVQLSRVGASNGATPNSEVIGQLLFDGNSTTPGYAAFASIDCTIGTNGASGAPANLNFNVADFSGNTPNRLIIPASGYIQPQTAQILQYQPSITTKSAAATLTAAEVYTGILEYTGSAATVTFPTGTQLQDDVFFWTTTNISLDFSVINTGSGTCTMAANGNTTVGSLTIAAGSSGKFRLRRTGSAAFTIYRIA